MAKWSVEYEDLLSLSILTADESVAGISIQLDPTAACVKGKEVKDITFFLMNSNEERTALFVSPFLLFINQLTI